MSSGHDRSHGRASYQDQWLNSTPSPVVSRHGRFLDSSFFRRSNQACVPAHLARLQFTTPPGRAVEPQGRKRASGILKTNAAPIRTITPPQSATRQRLKRLGRSARCICPPAINDHTARSNLCCAWWTGGVIARPISIPGVKTKLEFLLHEAAPSGRRQDENTNGLQSPT
jgi:hypothetical protein